MDYISPGNPILARMPYFLTAYVTVLCLAAVTPSSSADDKSGSANLSYRTRGLTAQEFARVPGVIFARALADVPGKNLVVVALEFAPKSRENPASPGQCLGHRHPGSTYVYVTKGTLRLGISGQPVQLVHAGESFFEPPGALHTVAESASATDPASAVAVLLVPDRAPILIPNDECNKS